MNDHNYQEAPRRRPWYFYVLAVLHWYATLWTRHPFIIGIPTMLFFWWLYLSRSHVTHGYNHFMDFLEHLFR